MAMTVIIKLTTKLQQNMETLELKLQKNVSQSEANKISTSHKNIDRLIMANDGSGLKIFHNNEFIPLQDGDCLCLNNILIAVSISEKTDLQLSSTILIESKSASPGYVEYEDVHLPMDTRDNQYHHFDVDTLLKDQPIANDPLNFLFQRNAPMGMPGLEYPEHNHNRQPLPLLKRHFDTQRVTIFSAENNKQPVVSEIASLEAEKSQGNILHELGLSG
jgi:hypothetical protein